MILPFVREFFADVENFSAFARAVAQTRAARPSGYVCLGSRPPARRFSTYCCIAGRARPLMPMVNDNRAVDELVPVLRSLAELDRAPSARFRRGACRPMTCCPSRTSRRILRSRKRAPASLWKIAVGVSRDRRHNRSPLRPCGCAAAASTPTWRGSFAAARWSMPNVCRASAHRRLQPGGCRRDAGRICASRRAARCLSAGVRTGRFALSSSATRSSPFASSIPRHNAPPLAPMKSSFCR